ncbi:hypothetical protein QEZ54_02945 [Catellatospora sp. KI3]|uniref:hypothetical protein n=1 Tax=Catellatospora sp. KI3 TaxID=3041620 RepID=UPI0024822D3B|nr:hypothetical protein [Catellatospora sp. KI3]MDI1459916.1 hypothetical protein [Catellatospora sp. KI3]
MPRPAPRRRAAVPLADRTVGDGLATGPTVAVPAGFGPGLVAVPGGGASAAAGEPVRRHHRMEALQRPRRIATDAGQTDIVLPDWLGPFTDGDTAPVRARHAG